MANINVLDCTLRDGGYVNDWSFSDEISINLIDSLRKSKIEYIELGYINKKNGKCKDTTMFNNIECINNIINDNDAKYVIMLDLGDFDIDDIEYNSNIFGIRLTFSKEHWRTAVEDVKKIIVKGFKVFLQPMLTLCYTDKELLELIKAFNEIDIYAFYIVDTFGAMQSDDVLRFASLIDNNLKSDVKLGFHAHNNLQLAYSNAIALAKRSSNRELIIDSSVYGMGRAAGNLNTELFADYLIKNFNKEYKIEPLLDIIDNFLSVIYKENYWGYSVAHYISGIYNCHPYYSTYLAGKKELSGKDIENIIKNIVEAKKYEFDKNYIEQLYVNRNSHKLIKYNYEFLKRHISG